MAEEKCLLDPSRDCLGLNKAKRIEEEFSEFRRQNSNTHDRIFDRLTNVDKSIAKLETLYNSLEGLPTTITNLDKTITVIGSKLESMDRNISDMKQSISNQEFTIQSIQKENTSQNESIGKIQNKTKVDWADFITQNFWKVLGIGGILYVAIRFILEQGG